MNRSNKVSAATRDLVAAVLGDEFADEPYDPSRLRAVMSGDVQEWIEALAGSGFFSRNELIAVAAEWTADPSILVDLLLPFSGVEYAAA